MRSTLLFTFKTPKAVMFFAEEEKRKVLGEEK